MISHSPERTIQEKEQNLTNRKNILKKDLTLKEKEELIQQEPDLDENLKNIRDLLGIQKGVKSIEELSFLFNFLMRYNFFKIANETYTKNTIISIIDSSEFIELQKDEIIINLGETVKSAYILLAGEIKISSHNPLFNCTQDDEEENNKLNENPTNLHLYSLDKLNYQNIKLPKPNEIKSFNIEDEWFVPIGDMFGDKCLIERKTRFVLINSNKHKIYNVLFYKMIFFFV